MELLIVRIQSVVTPQPLTHPSVSFDFLFILSRQKHSKHVLPSFRLYRLFFMVDENSVLKNRMTLVITNTKIKSQKEKNKTGAKQTRTL